MGIDIGSNTLRLQHHPVLGDRSAKHKQVTLHVDGAVIEARQGEVLSAVLWQSGLLKLGHHHADSGPRGMYCGIGHCYECRVVVDGVEDVRACLTLVKDGMVVSLFTQQSSGEQMDDR